MSTNRPLKKIEECLDKTSFFVGKIKTQDNLSEGKFPIIDQGKELIAGYSNDESLVYDGKLPVIIYGDHTNIVKYVDFPFICGADGTKVFKLKKDIDTKFFVYWLEHFKPETQGYRRHYSLLKEIEFPLPPLATQQLIVAKLDETFAQIDEAIATTQANIDKADELTKSVLDKRFNEGDMKFVDLDYVCSLITDGTHATPKYIESGIPFLSVKNITHGIIDFSDTRFVSKEEHQQLTKRCNPEFGDILYTKVGTTGIAKIIDVKRDFSIFVSLALLKVKKNIISNEYLEKILNSPLIYQQSQEKTRGVANRNLVIKDIKSIQIPLPSLNKQQEIVSYLDHVFAQSSQLKEQYQKKLVELKELKASVLQSAFEGKLV